MNDFLADEMVKHRLLNAAVESGVPLTDIFPEVSHALNVKAVPRVVRIVRRATSRFCLTTRCDAAQHIRVMRALV